MLSGKPGDVVNSAGERISLISILQQVQEREGYLSQQAISDISKSTGLSESYIFGVASFYSQFYFTRRGKHQIQVCLGTACHVRGGERIMAEVEKQVGIKPGETTSDASFSLDKVACFGSCALGPVMVVDKRVYGRMSPAKVTDILGQYGDNK
jgi:NADH-quinone oxidoreductase subunit E